MSRIVFTAVGVLVANVFILMAPAARSGWCWKVEGGVKVANPGAPETDVSASYYNANGCCENGTEVMSCHESEQCSDEAPSSDDYLGGSSDRKATPCGAAALGGQILAVTLALGGFWLRA
eukprot:CAMPEP_0170620912 /NCGR_PEP_ID=MMETSP0224-20130122/28318_1 /TAXON_ID=285029 /ORGANISM="Togula jolla, Strain CCCM 725" /LENGTH=119 /DNA_ID=CAMNT_0010947131 /DNA_START=51 /DNA_END=410 /DNA_ORIENTATION=+